MRCPVQHGNPEILLDYCSRRVSPEIAAILAQHMVLCENCRRIAEAHQQVWDALDVWKAETVSPDFDERLYARISAAERRSFWHRVVGDRLSWKPALPFAAAFATIALVFVLNVPRDRPDIAPGGDATAIEALEPEQIDRTVEDMEMLRQFSTPSKVKTL